MSFLHKDSWNNQHHTIKHGYPTNIQKVCKIISKMITKWSLQCTIKPHPHPKVLQKWSHGLPKWPPGPPNGLKVVSEIWRLCQEICRDLILHEPPCLRRRRRAEDDPPSPPKWAPGHPKWTEFNEKSPPLFPTWVFYRGVFFWSLFFDFLFHFKKRKSKERLHIVPARSI